MEANSVCVCECVFCNGIRLCVSCVLKVYIVGYFLSEREETKITQTAISQKKMNKC